MVEKLKASEENNLKLTENIDIAEEKIQHLLNINEDLENNCAVYIAHKNDQIDRKLANYLNTYPERKKLNIMFLRETDGVYKFGSKRVYIKIAQ